MAIIDDMTQKIIITLAIFAFGLANAQQLPFLYKVNVTTKVLSSKSQGYYNYYYRIVNSSKNIGSIMSFSVDVSRDSASLDLDTIGLIFAWPSMHRNFTRRFPSIKQNIVPFSFFCLPPNWDAAIGSISYAFTFLDTLFVLPGQEVDGIGLMSHGLPSVRSFSVEPMFDDDAYYGDKEPTPDEEDSVTQIISYYGKTVGPQSPPKIFLPTAWCDTISNYTMQSRTLGWITNQITADKYLGYFSSAQSQLQSNNIAGARSTLQTVLTNAISDSTSNLTSEAYALIRYNTEYLIMQLLIPSSK